MDTKALVDFAAARLQEEANAEKAAHMAAYMKTEQPFYGVQRKELTAIGREMMKRFAPEDRGDYEEGIRSLWTQPHREEQYLALHFARFAKPFVGVKSLEVYEELIRQGAWWDLVDEVATQIISPLYLKNRQTLSPVMGQWIEDSCLWIRRTAILSQLKHKENTNSDQLFEFCLRRAHETEFFIRKAIGWALRQYSYAAPDEVRDFLLTNQDHLSGLSFREGAKVLKKQGLM